MPRIEQPEKLPVTVASVVEVTASRLEHEEPPPVPLNSNGGRDFTERARWMQSRQDEYQQAALNCCQSTSEVL